jgi:hypothetical protein
MIFGMEKSIKNLPNLSIPFLGKILTPVTVCKDLGLTLDATLAFDDHINSLTSTLTSSLCQINRVRHLFDKNALLVMINCLVFANFTIVLRFGLAPPKRTLRSYNKYRTLQHES